MTRPLPPDPRLYDLAKDWALRFCARPLSQERANILCKQGSVPGAIQYPKTGPKNLRRWYVLKGTKECRKAHGRPMKAKQPKTRNQE